MKLNWMIYNNVAATVDLGVPVFVDLDDFCWIEGERLFISSKKYVGIKNNRLLHREITNCPNALVVDHINRNTFDNRKCNLRMVTRRENAMNSLGHSDRNSPHRGVYWDNKHKKWEVALWINGRNINHKRFNYVEDAVSHRLKLESIYFGEYSPDSTGPDAGPFAITPEELKEIL